MYKSAVSYLNRIINCLPLGDAFFNVYYWPGCKLCWLYTAREYHLTLVQIAVNRGLKQALYFISAFSIIEFIFTLFIIHAANWLAGQLKLDIIIDWVMIVLFSTLAVVTWIKRNKVPSADYSKYDSLKYGIILGFINPMQIPFWMICGTYLITHGWIVTGTLPLVIFSLGSAAGAFLCLFIYARAAKSIQLKFELSTQAINTSIAVLFFAFALYHLIKETQHLVLVK